MGHKNESVIDESIPYDAQSTFPALVAMSLNVFSGYTTLQIPFLLSTSGTASVPNSSEALSYYSAGCFVSSTKGINRRFNMMIDYILFLILSKRCKRTHKIECELLE